MAFDIAKLKSVGNNAGRGKTPMYWIYDNADGDTVTTAGFIPSNVGMSGRDQVLVVPSAGKGTLYAAIESSGVITLS